MADKKPRKKKDKIVVASDKEVMEMSEKIMEDHKLEMDLLPLDDGPKPLAYPDFFMTEMLRHNPNLLVYANKILDDTTSGYIRHGLRKFYMAKGIDRHEMSFSQKDLEQALADGFKV